MELAEGGGGGRAGNQMVPQAPHVMYTGRGHKIIEAGALSAVRAQYLASGRTGNPCFVILGASLLFDNSFLMLLSHWGYGVF